MYKNDTDGLSVTNLFALVTTLGTFHTRVTQLPYYTQGASYLKQLRGRLW